MRPLGRFPRLGPELGGRWSGFRFVLGPWRWMLVVYVYFDDDDRVVIVTVQDARSSRVARSRQLSEVKLERETGVSTPSTNQGVQFSYRLT